MAWVASKNEQVPAGIVLQWPPIQDKKEGEAGTGSRVVPAVSVGIAEPFTTGEALHEVVLYPAMEVHR